MAHHVLFGQAHLSDAVHMAQHLQGVDQTAAGLFGQVDLGHVAGDDHLAAHAHTGQEHLHLFGGGVLRLVQNDKGIVQRAPAHIGKGRDLNDLLFKQFLEGFRPQQIKQPIVQRAQIGVYLVLQVARQKAQLFAGFDRGAGQDNAADILGLERLDRHSHRQIGFAGAGGTHAEGDGVLADGCQILFLPQRFGVDGTSLGGDCHKIIGQLPQAAFLPAAGQADAVAHGLLLQRGVVLHQGDHTVNGVYGGGHVLILAGKPQLRAAANGGDAKFLFQQADILVAAAKNGGSQFNAVQFDRAFCQRRILPIL